MDTSSAASFLNTVLRNTARLLSLHRNVSCKAPVGCGPSPCSAAVFAASLRPGSGAANHQSRKADGTSP